MMSRSARRHAFSFSLSLSLSLYATVRKPGAVVLAFPSANKLDRTEADLYSRETKMKLKHITPERFTK